MRFILSFLLVFLCVFATAQVPPMSLGGPQGITAKRVLAEQWISIPVMSDTPVGPLTGAPWPGKGYLVHVAKANDTAVWQYTGTRWRRIGGAAEGNYTQLISGGKVTRNATLNRFSVGVSTYYIQGNYYSSGITTLVGYPKTANANGRIDVIALNTSGPTIIQGTEALNPISPNVGTSNLKLTFVYYPPYDTLPVISGNGIDAIFREPGVDSIFFSTLDTTISIKDSIGISTASNGLTANDKNVKMGGSLIENTNINLSGRRLNILTGSDTARFFSNGSLSLGATPSDSTYRFNVNGAAKMDTLVVDSLNVKFGTYTATPSTIFAPIEFRATSGAKTRIDLRPSSTAGWSSNWYGAITHNGYETDILSAPYGNLYLGSTGWIGNGGIYLGNTRNQPAMRIRNNNNVLIGDTALTAFKFDVNGTTRVRDTLTLATSPVTSDTAANDLLVINSSNGQVRRYTGDWFYKQSLEQTTAIGNSTTDSVNIRTPLGKLAATLTTYDFAGAENTAGNVKLRNTFDSSYIEVDYLGISKRFSSTALLKSISFRNIRNQLSQIAIPDSSGTLAQRVILNGTSYATADNGSINLGTIITDTSTVIKAYVTNAEAVTITKGQVVYIYGASGDRASVKLAKNTSDTFSSKTLGIVRDDIAAGAAGWVTTQGQVGGINLSAYTAGDILWLDSALGGFTKTKPIAPYHGVFIGVVERANVGNGLIYVKPQNGVELDELHDVRITSLLHNQVISYDTAQKVWKNVDINTVGSIYNNSASLDFGNTSAQNSADLTITVTGAALGDIVSLGVPNGSVNANTCFTAWVSATDTVTVRFNNYSSGAVDPASGTFKVKVFK